MPQICPQFADHRAVSEESYVTRQRIARIPTQPRGMGMAKAVLSGHITSGKAYECYERKQGNCKGNTQSRSYICVGPDGLFPTIVTSLTLQCAKNDVTLHWDQPRPLTIMEARRAQGFLDHEVIVGSPAQQWKIIGNSVDRNVSFALGLALRDSWMKRSDEQDGGDAESPSQDIDENDVRAYPVTESGDQGDGHTETPYSTADSSDHVSRTTERTVSTDDLQHFRPSVPSLRGTGGPQPTTLQLEQIHREWETRNKGRPVKNDGGSPVSKEEVIILQTRLKKAVTDNGLLTPGQDRSDA
jgi:hypothetical protein